MLAHATVGCAARAGAGQLLPLQHGSEGAAGRLPTQPRGPRLLRAVLCRQRITEGGLDMPAPILATLYTSLQKGIESFEQCRCAFFVVKPLFCGAGGVVHSLVKVVMVVGTGRMGDRASPAICRCGTQVCSAANTATGTAGTSATPPSPSPGPSCCWSCCWRCSSRPPLSSCPPVRPPLPSCSCRPLQLCLEHVALPLPWS